MQRKKSHRSQALSRLPLRDTAQKASLALMTGLGVALLVLSKTSPAFVSSVRMAVTDALLPVVEVAASPLEAASAIAARGRQWISLSAEVRALRAENAQLRRLELKTTSLEAENQALRKLMRVVPGGQASYITARLVADNAGPFMQAALISGGKQDGVARNQAVMTAGGLVGRVIEAGESSARLLLLTDVNSRVPVMGERAREKVILAGDNSPMPVLSYVAGDSRLSVGERLITSGDGGVFPPGIPVGEIVSLEGGAVRVRLSVDFTTLEYVTVVDYAL